MLTNYRYNIFDKILFKTKNKKKLFHWYNLFPKTLFLLIEDEYQIEIIDTNDKVNLNNT